MSFTPGDIRSPLILYIFFYIGDFVSIVSFAHFAPLRIRVRVSAYPIRCDRNTS